MPRFGKPDRTGRSSGIRTGRERHINSPPPGEPFALLTRELISSPAWRARSINCVRLIDFLLMEWMNHAGTENGDLKATYDQLVAYGLTRSEIRPATEEAEFLGLIRFERGGRWAGTNKPSRFRLTFYANKDGVPATNQWQAKTDEVIAEWMKDRVRHRQARRTPKKYQIPGSTSRTTVVRFPELRNDGRGETR